VIRPVAHDPVPGGAFRDIESSKCIEDVAYHSAALYGCDRIRPAIRGSQRQLEPLKVEYQQKLQNLEQRISDLEKEKSQATASAQASQQQSNRNT